MKSRTPPKFRAAKGWKIASRSAGSVELSGEGFAAQISVFAPGLIRFRISRGRRVHDEASWAVVAAADVASAEPSRWNAGEVGVVTLGGRFTLRLKTGEWQLTGANGRCLFRSFSGGTGYSGAEAQVNLLLEPGEALFGLGEATGQFDRRGMVRDFWNIDVLGHSPTIHPGLKQLYVSIPFAISSRRGQFAGLYWDNPGRQNWDLGQSRLDRWRMTAASGPIDLYLFVGPTPSAVVRSYSWLTGTMPLPPTWALGYHQCRYSYETASRLREVAREFRRRRLPCDALYLDIHHMDAYRVFTFGKTYPRPDKLMRDLARDGFKVVAIVDPGVKNDPSFGVLRRGVDKDAFVKGPDGERDFLGEVWPGESRFPDFLNAGVREWWGDEQKALLNAGVAGIWNDMNEPANFARPDKTLPPDAIHRTDFGVRTHAGVHNLYGMQMARASREGLLRHAHRATSTRSTPGADRARPFVITRAGYAGVQRHALVWTGDNSSNWDHLNDAVQMLLNLSVSGVPFCGSDVGGFMENATPELFVRWFQFAALTPFFRNHSNLGTIDQEPWAFGAEVELICRHYLELRYRLLPWIYCLFAEAHASGTPIIRPMFWHYPTDPVAVRCGDQFLLGESLLVAPILRQGAVARSAYLPAGIWHDFWTGECIRGGRHVIALAPLDRLPIWVRAGTILPLGTRALSVASDPPESIQLRIWPGATGALRWYEDDGDSQAYVQGDFSRRSIEYRERGGAGYLAFGPPTGARESSVKRWEITVVQPGTPANLGAVRKASGSGKTAGCFLAENQRREFRVKLSN